MLRAKKLGISRGCGLASMMNEWKFIMFVGEFLVPADVEKHGGNFGVHPIVIVHEAMHPSANYKTLFWPMEAKRVHNKADLFANEADLFRRTYARFGVWIYRGRGNFFMCEYACYI